MAQRRVQEGAEKARKPQQHDDTFPDTTEAPQKLSGALKADLDEVLDEVDSVLEENAEEFIKGFVQKGGE